MKFWTTATRQRGAGQCAAVCLMLVLWLGTFALVAVPQLHRLLHADAGGPEHTCLITQIQQQPLLAGSAPPVAPAAPPAALVSEARAVFQVLPTCDYRLSPSRAPPFAGSLRFA